MDGQTELVQQKAALRSKVHRPSKMWLAGHGCTMAACCSSVHPYSWSAAWWSDGNETTSAVDNQQNYRRRHLA